MTDSQRIVSEIQNNYLNTFILSFIFVMMISFSLFFLGKGDPISQLAQILTSILIMAMIACVDNLTGRIPVIFLAISAVAGIFFSYWCEYPGSFIAGGAVNFILGALFHFSGKQYQKKHTKYDPEVTAFGWGDVYGAGALGFLLGFPNGLIAFLLALLLGLCLALIQAIIQKQRFLKIRFRLGVAFFTAALIVLAVSI